LAVLPLTVGKIAQLMLYLNSLYLLTHPRKKAVLKGLERGLDSTRSEDGPMAGSCHHSNKHWGSMKLSGVIKKNPTP
jgi:hypothetical protein